MQRKYRTNGKFRPVGARQCSWIQIWTISSVIILLWNSSVSQCSAFGNSDNRVTMWLMLLEEMIPGCGWLPAAVIAQPHQNHDVLNPGRAHTRLVLADYSYYTLFLPVRPTWCQSDNFPTHNRHSAVTDSLTAASQRFKSQAKSRLNITWHTNTHICTKTHEHAHWALESGEFTLKGCS